MLFPKLEVIVNGEKTWVFNSVISGEITEDMETLTDTCTIEMPKKIKWDGSDVVPLKRGNEIIVKVGYDEPKVRFIGFIKKVALGNPVKLECEDYMYELKQIALEKKGYKSATLDLLISSFLLNTGIKYKLIDDIVIGNYRVTKETVAQELDQLKKEFGLKSYFRLLDGEPVLYVGLGYPLDNRQVVDFAYGHNLTVDKYELSFQQKEDVLLKVKATSVQRDNSRKEIEVGDNDGDVVSVYKYSVDESELRKFAESELERLKYTGLRGSFGTIGEPAITKCDIANIKIENGEFKRYLVKKVVVGFGAKSFFSQKVTIGVPL